MLLPLPPILMTYLLTFHFFLSLLPHTTNDQNPCIPPSPFSPPPFLVLFPPILLCPLVFTHFCPQLLFVYLLTFFLDQSLNFYPFVIPCSFPPSSYASWLISLNSSLTNPLIFYPFVYYSFLSSFLLRLLLTYLLTLLLSRYLPSTMHTSRLVYSYILLCHSSFFYPLHFVPCMTIPSLPCNSSSLIS